MNELTDLEIIKRIAEIESVKVRVDSIIAFESANKTPTGAITTSARGFEDVYNPLTDDGLCLRLMFKYGVQLIKETPDYNIAQCEHSAVRYLVTEMPNKSSMLAIIEANNEN